MIKVLSLDLQGTLSDSSFSNYFWIELLPIKYSEKYKVTLSEAKKVLGDEFKRIGVYNTMYYDDYYWSRKLDFDTLEELDKMSLRPILNDELFNLIDRINLPKIIISTTTNTFIKYELGERFNDFYKIYSCIDDFGIGGKTRDVFLNVCSELGVKPNEVLHIGDNKTMDFDNARESFINAILFDGNINNLERELKRYLEG